MKHTAEKLEGPLFRTFCEWIEPISARLYDMDPLLFTDGRRKKKATPFRTDPYAPACDSARIRFARDTDLYPNYPFIRIASTPFGFLYTVSCPTFSGEKMNILRRLAITNDPRFERAWRIVNDRANVRIEGKTYLGPRYTMYPQEFNRFMEYRNVIFQLFDKRTPQASMTDLTRFADENVRLIKPLYELLVAASEYEGTDFMDKPVFDPWDPEKN